MGTQRMGFIISNSGINSHIVNTSSFKISKKRGWKL